MSPAGITFSQQRTAASFQAWSTAAPTEAAGWLRTVAGSLGATAAAAQVDAFLAAAPGTQAPDTLGAVFGQLQAQTVADVQAARSATLGWTAGVAEDAPALTGTVGLEGGEPVLQTPAGTFQLVNANFFQLENNDWQKNHFLGGRDALAFAGRTVTVRGWPDASWSPGGRAKLVVEEFAPGSSPDFVCGRVVSDASGVSISVRPDKKVKVTDPTLAAALALFDQLGVILPGASEKTGDTLSYGKNPVGYYVLGGFRGTPAESRLPDGTVQLDVQVAHGRRMPVELPQAAFDGGPMRAERHYLFGRLEGGVLKAQDYSLDTGPWVAGAGVVPVRTAQFAEVATPVEVPVGPAADFMPAPVAGSATTPAPPSVWTLIALTPDQRFAGYPVGGFSVIRGFGVEYPEYAARLGRPLENEHGDGGDGATQRFERGVMNWDPRQNVRVTLT